MNSYVCFGEVLWDVFPDFSRIGGAPLNVASRLANFGNSVEMISCIGSDEAGAGIISYLKARTISAYGLQISDRLETGVVEVRLDNHGVATYSIKEPVAWDEINWSEELSQIVEQGKVLVFGSLVCRGEISRSSLKKLLAVAHYKVFDVNLRPPYYSTEVLGFLMSEADFVKFNEEELLEITGVTDKQTGMKTISDTYDVATVCVTRGAAGALLLHGTKWYEHPGFRVEVVDTVGAGDSFLATLLHYLFSNEDPQMALTYACAVGAMVAAEEGANPVLDQTQMIEFIAAQEE